MSDNPNSHHGIKDLDLKQHKTTLLIGLVGVVISYLILRRMKASSTGGVPASQATNNTGTNSGGLSSSDISTVEGQLAGLSTDLANLKGQEATDIAAVSGQASADQAKNLSLLAQIQVAMGQFGDKLAAVGATASNAQNVTSGLSQSSGDAPASLPANVIQNMLANGERIVKTVKSSTGGWLYLTNKGGVYNSGGSTFYGSYVGYAQTTANPGAEVAGHGDFSSGDLVPLAGGHYSEINSHGESYTF